MMRSRPRSPIAPESACARIDKDDRGRWIVSDGGGNCGGPFANSKDAIHFAMFERAREPRAVILAPPKIER